MAPSNSGRVPIVIDLTIDSDSDNACDETPPTRKASATSKIATASLPPAFRSSNVPRPVAGSLTTPASLPGGSHNAQSWRPSGAYPQATRTPVVTNTLASSSKPTTTSNPSNMGHSISAWKSFVPTPSMTPSSVDGLKGTDRSAKRRKLSTPLRRETEQSSTQTQPLGHIGGKQPNRHGIATSTQAQRATGTSRPPKWGGVKLNNMNMAPSVHHMNSASKPNGSISYLENARTQAPRSLLTGRLAEGGMTTGLPSPGLTTPESVSVIVIDSDSLDGNESDIASTSPAADDTKNARKMEYKGESTFQGDAGVSDKSAHTPTVRAPQSPRPSFLLEPVPVHSGSHEGEENVPSSSLVVRQTISQTIHQDQIPPRALKRSSSPSSAIMKPLQPNDEGITEEADHFIIFLKEVKGLRWAEITTEFAKDFPRRSHLQLQTRYSHVLNKRDRTQDPATLNLPARFATAATIDWKTVRANTAVSKIRTEVESLGISEAPSLDRQQFGKSHAFQQIRDHDDSSGTDSAPQRQRPRRAAPINYTWSKLRTTEGGIEEEINEEKFAVGLNLNREVPACSELQTDETLVTSDYSVEARKIPLKENHNTDAWLGLATRTDLRSARKNRVPYLSTSQRLAIHAGPEGWAWDQRVGQDWQGAILHVDFSPTELQTVQNVIAKIIQSARQTRHSTYRRHLRAILKDLAEPRLQQLAYEISRHLHSRDAQSIRSFLNDAAAGKVSDMPQVQRLAMVKQKPELSSIQQCSISTVVRQRELGLQSRRGWKAASTPLTYQIQNQMTDTLGPRYTWTGASSDVHTVAWSPVGQHFAAGAVAVTDIDSMQYNRPNNLLYIDTTSGVLQELGGHCIDRPKTKAGANSTHAMYVSQDPKLYTTVSSVAFSPSGRLMYSAGYDQSVCIWEVSASNTHPQLTRQLQHKAPVDILAVNQHCNGLIATAAKRTTDKSIKLVYFDEETVNDQEWHHTRWDFASAKAINRPDFRMTANALQFSPTDGTLLLAGFSANIREDNGLDTTGDICLWDVNTQRDLHVHGSSRNVFDVTFNPDPRVHSLLAVGCVASGNVNRGTRSVVRFYTTKGAKDSPSKKFMCPLELECPAYDMNDIVWCPHDENLFAAGCTDGRSYVWDLRKPDQILYTLSHGASLSPLQDDVPYEKTDTGVRFLSWGQNTTRLYSGSSDGIVKVWDVTRSQEDTFVKNLVTTDSGIMSGALSPDYSKLVLGEVNGSVNVLEVGRDDISIKDAEKLQYHSYHNKDTDDDEFSVFGANSRLRTNTIAAEAQRWLETGQLQTVPMGGFPKNQVIQGPNYKGPFDRSQDAHTHALRKQAFMFQRKMAATKGPQCDLPVCLDSVNTTTYEEVGDSGRSVDRIPDELRQQWLDESVRVVPGKSKCTHCSRPARPSTDLRKAVFCERCSFTCFRCGWENELAGLATTFDCRACGGTWSIGALGYEYDQAYEPVDRPLDIPPLEKFAQESYIEGLKDADTTFGDEMNALTDHYFAMALNQPGSPLL